MLRWLRTQRFCFHNALRRKDECGHDFGIATRPLTFAAAWGRRRRGES
jgi:hypothetical protein